MSNTNAIHRELFIASHNLNNYELDSYCGREQNNIYDARAALDAGDMSEAIRHVYTLLQSDRLDRAARAAALCALRLMEKS